MLKSKRERRVVASHSLQGRLEMIKRFLLYPTCELGTEAIRYWRFVRDYAPAGLLHRVYYRLLVPG